MELNDLKCLRSLINNFKVYAALPYYPTEFMNLDKDTLSEKLKLCHDQMKLLKSSLVTALTNHINGNVEVDPVELLGCCSADLVREIENEYDNPVDEEFVIRGIRDQEIWLCRLINIFNIELPDAKCFRDLLITAETLELFATTMEVVKESLVDNNPIFLPVVPDGQYTLEDLTVYGYDSIIKCLRKRLENYDKIFSSSTNEVQTYWNNMKKHVTQSSKLNKLLLEQCETAIPKG